VHDYSFSGCWAKLCESGLFAQLLRFGTVGTSGFLIDTAIVYALAGRLGLYVAGLVSYLVAASWCWALNRAWTFRSAAVAWLATNGRGIY
jgi:putative flippase GtrA